MSTTICKQASIQDSNFF